MTLFCTACGEEREWIKASVNRCDHCGNHRFSTIKGHADYNSPMPSIPWALSEPDRFLLRAFRIDPDK